MKKLLLLVSAAALCGTSVAFAQEQSENTGKSQRGIEIVRPDAELTKILKKDSEHDFKQAPVPAFVVHTRDNKFMLTVGGQINPIFGYDFGNNLYKTDAGISFVTQDIPVPAVAGKKADYYINPLNGALTFQIVGFGGTDNQISAFFKIGTNGNTPNINFTRAWLTWRGITAGQKLTLLQDDYACQPPTIDPEGPSGCVSTVAYEISYKSKSYNGFRFAVGLDMPTYYHSNGRYQGKDYPEFDGKMVVNPEGAEHLMPDVPAWVEYQYSQWNRIRLSGIYRNFSYRDLINNKKKSVSGYGVMLSGNFQPINPLIFYFQAMYGKGIGAYLQDIAGLPLSFTPSDDKLGHMKANPMMGINVGLTWNITDQWQANAMGSVSRIWDVENYVTYKESGQNYRYANYYAANVFYNITPYLQWGLEYLYGKRATYGLGSGHDNRIQTQIMFTF